MSFCLMEVKEIAEEEHGFPPVSPLIIGIAIDGKRKSKYAVGWALQTFIPEGKVVFKLLHVRPPITAVPTPMGNSIPIAHVRDDVALAYKKDIEWQNLQMLLPWKKICTQRKVQADIIIIESDDVPKAIAEEVSKCTINKLVIGASSHGMFKRKVKGEDLSCRISTSAPSYCTVYVVSKGKLSSIRPSDSETNRSLRDDLSVASGATNTSSKSISNSQMDVISVTSYGHFCSPKQTMHQFQGLTTINQGQSHSQTNSTDSNNSGDQSLDFKERQDVCSSTSGDPGSQSSSCKSLSSEYQSWDQASISAVSTSYSSDSQENISFELEKLKIELRHVRGIYAVAQSEAFDASRKFNELSKRRLEEAMKLTEISNKEKEAKELARREKERFEDAIREADCTRKRAEREASLMHEAMIKATRDAKEKEKFEIAVVGPLQQYQKFPWEEIVSATSSFSENLKIGVGAFGIVYKCSLYHTTAAVKVLHSKEKHNTKQFQQELDILSKIHHPHLLILLGACPDQGCLVYEYMENGSLEDRLMRVNNTPPIPWFERYRIAWEVASALVFLHTSKPKQIIHRDLKPANILLDHNLVSKIGDVGLSTMLNYDVSDITTLYKDTGPVGTLCYMDPEYQRTGLISPLSDVYAFGMVILQLLTAKPAVALTHMMETAVDENRLADILDSEAGNWPSEETLELARLGLRCTELRRKDRPDLKYRVLPALERLKEIGDRARDAVGIVKCTAPSHFICPILKDVMNDPCVAADGYTYDRKAIKKWLEEDDKSPMTNLAMPSKNLLPNYNLLSAIMEWKSKS